MVNFPMRIPDCDSHSPTLLDLFLPSGTGICSTMAFPPLGNSDHVVVRAYFRKIKHSGIWCFVKSALSETFFFFLNLNKMCQKHSDLGDSTSTAPSGLSKYSFVKQRCFFIEVKRPFPRIFWFNSFILDKTEV